MISKISSLEKKPPICDGAKFVTNCRLCDRIVTKESSVMDFSLSQCEHNNLDTKGVSVTANWSPSQKC